MLGPEELRHLRSGPRDGEKAGGAGLIEVLVEAPEARRVLTRTREVLQVVVEHADPSAAAGLREALPAWFVHRCAPPRPEAVEQRWLDRWRSLGPTGRTVAERDRAWSLEDRLCWFEPDQRHWWWWSAEVGGDHHLLVSVEVDGWPAPVGALTWLLRAAGAVRVEVDG